MSRAHAGSGGETWNWLATAAMLLLVLCVNWAPAALGSNRLLPWTINALAAGCALLLAALHARLAGRTAGLRLGPAALPLAALCAVMAWIAAQALLPVPQGLAHPLWQQAAELAQLELPHRLSANPHETLLGLTRLATAVAVAVAAMLLARAEGRARLLLDAFVAAAVLYALYGLVRLTFLPGKVLWFDAPAGAYLTGPFLGRNQAATYFGLAALAALATLLDGVRRLARPLAASAPRMQLAGMLALLPTALGARLAAFVLLVSALLLTGSRAGIAATLIALAAVALLTAARRMGASGSSSRPLRLFAAMLAALVVLVLAIAGGRAAERLLAGGLEPGARLDVYRTSAAAVLDRPWLGSGYGTFQDIFPLYRQAAGPASLTWDKAHNDYLELLLGLGIPAATLLLAALVAAAFTAARGGLRRRRHAHIPAVAAAASLLVGLHALVDFSLQIQAVTLAFAMLIGAGLAQAIGSGAPAPAGAPSGPMPRFHKSDELSVA